MVPINEQRSRVLILVNSCVHILYGISTMILVSFAVSLIANETHTENGIQKNWETNMIIDIQSSRYDSCPAGYEPMFSYNWPGTSPACNCYLWNDNPQRPHGPDGEYSQIGLNSQKFSIEDIEKGNRVKSPKKNNKNMTFVQNKLEEGKQVEQDEQEGQIQVESEQLNRRDSPNNYQDLKKQIKHNKKNQSKYDQTNFQYAGTKETQEEVLNKLAKYGQENKIYTDGVCNWNQTQAGCVDIMANKQMQFTKWKQRLQWCVARAQAVNMSTMQKYYDLETGTCKDEKLFVIYKKRDFINQQTNNKLIFTNLRRFLQWISVFSFIVYQSFKFTEEKMQLIPIKASFRQNS